MEKKINDICKILTEKINSASLSESNYISTENMLPNFEGITIATSIPKGNVTYFKKDDILLSNIRPYFKKVWHAKFDGGCSNDVIVIRPNSESVLPKFLFYAIANEKFIKYYNSSCKGTKMPRGNKEALLDWSIKLPTREEQQHIINIILFLLLKFP